LAAQAVAGYFLFVGRANCVACHRIGASHALFADDEFHFIGTGFRPTPSGAVGDQSLRVPITLFDRVPALGVAPPRPLDLGRQEVTGHPEDLWRYRTPSLRNVAVTAPYMHDGSFATLTEVVRHYNYPGVAHPQLNARIKSLALDTTEMAALVAFLESLTGDNLSDLANEARAANPPAP
jgi:cytochrome c peroxidase